MTERADAAKGVEELARQIAEFFPWAIYTADASVKRAKLLFELEAMLTAFAAHERLAGAEAMREAAIRAVNGVPLNMPMRQKLFAIAAIRSLPAQSAPPPTCVGCEQTGMWKPAELIAGWWRHKSRDKPVEILCYRAASAKKVGGTE